MYMYIYKIIIIFIGTYKRTQLKFSTKKTIKMARESATYNHRHV